MATMEEIINDVLRELSHAPGRNAQLYLQDRISKKVQDIFDSLFTQTWWDDFFKTEAANLNINGTTSVNFKDKIKRLMDVHSIYYENDTDPLPWAPKGTNLSRIQARCIYPAESDNAPFTIAPLGNVGKLVVNYRTYIDTPFGLDDEVPFDKQALGLGAAYAIAVADGLNQGLVQRLQAEFTQRVDLLKRAEIRSNYNIRPQRPNPIEVWTVNG